MGEGGEPKATGIFLMRGGHLRIPAFEVNFDEDGNVVDSQPVQLEVVTDVWKDWLSIAIDHAVAAHALSPLMTAAYQAGDDVLTATHLEACTRFGMQAMTAAAFAVDAFYASVRERVPLPPAVYDGWQRNRTARYRRICETLRRAFALRPQDVVMMRSALEQIFRFRDVAVHPPADFRPTIEHPDLRVGVEPRHIWFRASNAEAAVRGSCRTMWLCANLPGRRNGTDALREWIPSQAEFMAGVVERWNSCFSPFAVPRSSLT